MWIFISCRRGPDTQSCLWKGAPEAAKAEGWGGEGVFVGRGVNLHRPPCCSSPCFSLSLAQGTLLTHSTAKVHKIEQQYHTKTIQRRVFPSAVTEWIRTYFTLLFRHSTTLNFLLEEHRYSTKMHNPGRQGNFWQQIRITIAHCRYNWI